MAGLTNLIILRLVSHSIFDISPLVGLNNLTRLRLDYNPLIRHLGVVGVNPPEMAEPSMQLHDQTSQL